MDKRVDSFAIVLCDICKHTLICRRKRSLRTNMIVSAPAFFSIFTSLDGFLHLKLSFLTFFIFICELLCVVATLCRGRWVHQSPRCVDVALDSPCAAHVQQDHSRTRCSDHSHPLARDSRRIFETPATVDSALLMATKVGDLTTVSWTSRFGLPSNWNRNRVSDIFWHRCDPDQLGTGTDCQNVASKQLCIPLFNHCSDHHQFDTISPFRWSTGMRYAVIFCLLRSFVDDLFWWN